MTESDITWNAANDEAGPTSVAMAWVKRLSEPAFAINAALAAMLLAIWFAAYRETILALADRWSTDPNYSHGFLVPLVSLYLLFQHELSKSESKSTINGGMICGSLLIVLGLLARCITLLMASLLAECVSMLFVLSGLAMLVGGWQTWRRAWAPIAFLFFMVPWPSAIYSRIAFPLQMLVSNVAAVILQIVGIPVLRDGNLIHLPGQTMHVAEACSGLRQLTAFLAICACAALLSRRPTWYRMTLLLSAIPIAVVINVVRVTATGLILNWGGASWIEGSLHTAEGMVMVALGLGGLMLEIAVLDWLLETQPTASETAPVEGAAV